MNKVWISIIIVLLLIVFLYTQNNFIKVTKLKVNIRKDLGIFNGLKILHLSDLHNKSFGKNQNKIMKKIKSLNPDIIFFTGDLIDSRRDGIENGVALLKECSSVASVYYITGNHEERSEKSLSLYEELNKLNVNILNDNNDILIKGEYKLNIIGVRDKTISKGKSELISKLENINMEKSDINILLAHRPSYIEHYTTQNFDLVFSGHAHGGQIRVPLIGGLLAPDQGILPQYDSGLYKIDKTNLIVSRGLGNSLFPQRLFNIPQIILITLK
ncbi:metallophosphoesterase [Senegalia massiliensis]|uniref:metallophosphoesterase n=1 Tax=Senegalia massiliensis TaxID=1720316 RepID=UPI001031238D|nr:metallophosphoesterase [Senegalia massiliensis]